MKIPPLIRYAVLCGALYGGVVYFVMQGIVRLSAVQPFPFSTASMIRGIITHILCVGIPLALQIRQTVNRT